ncbi:MAG: DUF2656 domain-containing protein [Moorea sp. SIO4A3]|nr:DUF2656 domain-containing protein [Moorena sp. SIO4A3]
MTDSQTGRMLLSHNFELSDDSFPELNREEFTQVFAQGLSNYPSLKCRKLDHPHWMVEILFPTQDFTPPQVGELCAKALDEKRISQKKGDFLPDILILGGLKKTPPLSNSPDTLQTGEWGVDVVETTSAEQFLTALGWDEKTTGKTIDNVFKIEKINNTAS